MKILIIGGHGFVGKNINELLKDSPHEVISLSRVDGFDLTDYKSTEEHLTKLKPDVIMNCAAHVGSLHYVSEYTADVVDDNTQMILCLYRAVKNVCPQAKVINPISNCSYPGDALVQEESEYWDGAVHQSVWSFANSKRMWVVVSECYERQYNINTVNFLAANSYGPGDYTDPNKTHALNGMIIRMLKAKAANESQFEIWGTGKPTREWLYVKDLASMMVQAIDMKEPQATPINIGQNKAYAIRETAEMIKELAGYEGELTFNTSYQDGAPTKQLDDKLFRSRYPDFAFTDISEGIKETIAYYQKALNL